MCKLTYYNLISSFSREENENGGTVILTRNNIKATPISKLNKLSIKFHYEISAIHVSNIDLVVICLYRSPTANYENFLSTMNKVLNCMNISKTIIMVAVI